jgi:hypothetical protein
MTEEQQKALKSVAGQKTGTFAKIDQKTASELIKLGMIEINKEKPFTTETINWVQKIRHNYVATVYGRDCL